MRIGWSKVQDLQAEASCWLQERAAQCFVPGPLELCIIHLPSTGALISETSTICASGPAKRKQCISRASLAQVLDDSTCKATCMLVDNKVVEWRERGVNIQCIRRNNRQGYKAGALKEVRRRLSASIRSTLWQQGRQQRCSYIVSLSSRPLTQGMQLHRTRKTIATYGTALRRA